MTRERANCTRSSVPPNKILIGHLESRPPACVLVSHCRSVLRWAERGNDESCPVLKVAPVGRKAREAVVMKRSPE